MELRRAAFLLNAPVQISLQQLIYNTTFLVVFSSRWLNQSAEINQCHLLIGDVLCHHTRMDPKTNRLSLFRRLFMLDRFELPLFVSA